MFFKPNPKQKEIKLKGRHYTKLKKQVFERDEWKCRNPNCGSSWNLTMHHLIPRSKQRLDTIENNITLCVFCHTLVTDGLLDVKTWKKRGGCSPIKK